MKKKLLKIRQSVKVVALICLLGGFLPDMNAQTTIGDYMEPTPGFNLENYSERLKFVRDHQTRSHYGTCGRCGIQWRYADGKNVMYSERGGMFAICQHCWNECVEQERIFYYTELWKAQIAEYGEDLNRGEDNLKTLIDNIKKTL